MKQIKNSLVEYDQKENVEFLEKAARMLNELTECFIIWNGMLN